MLGCIVLLLNLFYVMKIECTEKRWKTLFCQNCGKKTCISNSKFVSEFDWVRLMPACAHWMATKDNFNSNWTSAQSLQKTDSGAQQNVRQLKSNLQLRTEKESAVLINLRHIKTINSMDMLWRRAYKFWAVIWKFQKLANHSKSREHQTQN